MTVTAAAKILKLLLQGRTPAFIAGDCHVTRQTVADVGELYGYGTDDFEVVERRLDELVGMVDAGKGDVLIDFAAGFEDDAPREVRRAARSLAAWAGSGRAEWSAGGEPAPGDVEHLLARAAHSPVQRTRTLGERIKRELADLVARLTAEEKAAAARGEVDRLEAELRAARASLPNAKAEAVRDQVCTVSGCSPDRVFTAPGLSRHRTRMHAGVA
ncbi:MAG: hypothetical protein ABI047_03290 [Jatrophihabitantaceae bacterium]